MIALIFLSFGLLAGCSMTNAWGGVGGSEHATHSARTYTTGPGAASPRAGANITGACAAVADAPGPAPTPKNHSFQGNVAINAATAKMRLVQVAEEIIAV